MLPEQLRRPLLAVDGADRPPSPGLVLGADGCVLARFARGLIRSVATLTYAQVQAAADGAPDNRDGTAIETVVAPVWAAWHAADGRATCASR